MKRYLLFSILSLPLLVGQAYAMEKQNESKAGWMSIGVIGVIGGLIGGPAGAIAGVSGAALLNRHDRLEHALSGSLKRVDGLQQRSVKLTKENQKIRQRIERSEEIRINRLRAIVGGFSLSFYFRTGRMALEKAAREQLDRLGVTLRAFPELHVQLFSGADLRGSDQYNLALAERRANTVQQALVDKGVSASRIHLHPLGEQLAGYPVNDIEGLMFDRQVCITFSLTD